MRNQRWIRSCLGWGLLALACANAWAQQHRSAASSSAAAPVPLAAPSAPSPSADSVPNAVSQANAAALAQLWKQARDQAQVQSSENLRQVFGEVDAKVVQINGMLRTNLRVNEQLRAARDDLDVLRAKLGAPQQAATPSTAVTAAIATTPSIAAPPETAAPPATAATPVPGAFTMSIGSMERNLAAWAKTANWEFRWEPGYDIRVVATKSYGNDFRQALQELGRDLYAAKLSLTLEVYEGNHVLRVVDPLKLKSQPEAR